ncbi:MAG: pyroglutamyl-peptidase I [Usitatibacter sp.]
MLRRKSRSPKSFRKHATHATPAHAGQAPRSRRRARPDAAVPAELILKPEVKAAILQPRAAPREARPNPPQPYAAKAPSHREVVLVTGFEPFGGEKTNPSWEVCRQLGSEIAGMRVETCLVPCEFRRSIEVVADAIERLHPVLVICVGQAGGRDRMGVERVGINVDDARIADNAGAQPIDETIAANGPPAYFATVPIKAMALAMREARVPAEVSNSAGTFVCNHLMYGVLHFIAASGHRARAGFIHVPYSEEQALDKPRTPSMSIGTMVKGVQAAIAAARTHHHDIQAAGGALD